MSIELCPDQTSAYGFADHRGSGYSASQADGVMVLDGGALVPFARPLQLNGVTIQENLMDVYGDDNLAFFDGEEWRKIDVDAD